MNAQKQKIFLEKQHVLWNYTLQQHEKTTLIVIWDNNLIMALLPLTLFNILYLDSTKYFLLATLLIM